MSDQGTDFILSELLSELKTVNDRKFNQIKDLQKIVATVVISALCTVLIVVAGFLWYLSLYDYTSTETVTNTAEGFYAIVDSEGNVISSDLTPEEIETFIGTVADGEGS